MRAAASVSATTDIRHDYFAKEAARAVRVRLRWSHPPSQRRCCGLHRYRRRLPRHFQHAPVTLQHSGLAHACVVEVLQRVVAIAQHSVATDSASAPPALEADMLSLLMFSRVSRHEPACGQENPMRIEAENAAHHGEVDAVTRAAFAGGDEAELIERLRADGLVRLSLVAVDDGRVVGHAMFTTLHVVVDGRIADALCLAPVSVLPQHQRRGIGSMLIRDGLARCKALGCEAVVVLGHAAYYPRFGFSAALASKLAAPFAGESFMALELVEGALAGAAGAVVYPPAFGIDGGH
ncbi:GNAT family N-acetyltransferase [Lysobacter sp. CA196]|uniref:GNAT family N-acetyltransferase n=1 Tax=Lysobacter sp. CA196 TaxID=3455606 RepID=UPI003F8D0909